jgi:hypothetical protein
VSFHLFEGNFLKMDLKSFVMNNSYSSTFSLNLNCRIFTGGLETAPALTDGDQPPAYQELCE